MPRPDHITNECITRYQETIQQDPYFPKELLGVPMIMEVCYAGAYLAEKLEQLLCPEELIIRLQFHGGKLSFGRDPWEVHQQLLKDYKNDTLEYEAEPSVLN
jgi:hypothetical protein